MGIRIVVAGGGTGGHLFPGIAVVEEMRRQGLDPEVTFIGTERGIEARILPKLGEAVRFLDIRPLKGRSARELVRSLGLLPTSGARAAQHLRELKPDLVIGVGGYAAGPVLAAAVAMRIPTAIMEQNAVAGLTNRLLARHVGRVYASFEGTFAKKGTGDEKRIVVSGNPIRRALVDEAHARDMDPDAQQVHVLGPRQLLVLGGSQGALALNEQVPRLLRAALDDGGVTGGALRVVHQVGRGDRTVVEQAYVASEIEADVVEFIDDMTEAYRRSELVIARAGASTVAEICALGCASVLVPFPHAADDHQTKNALALEAAGAAVHLAESELLSKQASEVVASLLTEPSRRQNIAQAARSFGRPDAAATIVDDLVAWLGWHSDAGRRGAANHSPMETESGRKTEASALAPPQTMALRRRSAENNVFGRCAPYIPSGGGALRRRAERLADEPAVPFVICD